MYTPPLFFCSLAILHWRTGAGKLAARFERTIKLGAAIVPPPPRPLSILNVAPP